MAKTNEIRPLGDRVLVEIPAKRDPTTATPGGILLPDTARGRADRGVVIAVGRGRVSPKGQLVEPAVKRGDRVLFDAYRIEYIVGQQITAATPQAKPGDRFLIREDDIRGVLM